MRRTHQEFLELGGEVVCQGRNVQVANDQDENHLD